MDQTSGSTTPGEWTTAETRGERGEIEALVGGLTREVGRRGYPEASKFAVRLAIEEAISNAVRHGNKGRGLPVRVSWRVTDDEVSIEVEDRGEGFDPDLIPDPTLDENLEVPAGRGIMLMRAYMTDVRYEGRGNRVRMMYRRPSPPGGARVRAPEGEGGGRDLPGGSGAI